MKDIIIFTDGAVPNNQHAGNRKGGVGVFFGDNDNRNISFSLKESPTNKVTNQVCELLACIKALKVIVMTEKIKEVNLYIHTDSMYVINSITKWAKKWEQNNWKKADKKPILNQELIKKLYYLSINMNVTYNHVKAHKTEPSKYSQEYYNWYGNYMADKLAVQATLVK